MIAFRIFIIYFIVDTVLIALWNICDGFSKLLFLNRIYWNKLRNTDFWDNRAFSENRKIMIYRKYNYLKI